MQYSAPNFTWSGPHMGLSGTKHQKTNFANSFGANLLPDIPEITGFICQYSIQICIKFCENKCTLKWFKSKRWQQCIFPASFWGVFNAKTSWCGYAIGKASDLWSQVRVLAGHLGQTTCLCHQTVQELIMEMRYPNVTWHIILPVYLFTTELRHTCSALIFV